MGYQYYNGDIGGYYAAGLLGATALGGKAGGKAFEYTQKARRQMDEDIYHGFPSMIDNMGLKYGVRGTRTGRDGISKNEITLQGSINGKDGVYSWIEEPGGSINHRFFEKGRR